MPRLLAIVLGLTALAPFASGDAPRLDAPGAAVALGGQAPGSQAAPQGPVEALREGFRLIERGELAAAQPLFERALLEAVAAKSLSAEADARRGLGTLASRTQRHEAARAELERALALYETLSDRSGAAWTLVALGNVLYTNSDRERARELYLRAIEMFQTLGDLAGENEVLYKIAYSPRSPEEAVRMIERGLIVSRQLGDKNSEGVYFLIWGSRLAAQGDYAAAIERLQQSIECIEEYGGSRPEAWPNLALALTSLGRLYQSHGEFERAIAIYRRALAVHEQSDEPHRTLPILGAIASGHQALKDYKTALQLHQQILDRARASASKSWIGLAMGRVGGSYLDLGDYGRAVQLLQEAIPQNEPAAQAVLYHQLSAAYSALGRDEAALEAAEKAVALSGPLLNWETKFDAFHRRAQARRKRGLTSEALADARDAILALEQVRARIVPADFLKRGFGDLRQAASTLTIGLLCDLGRYQEAFEAAEQGRSRAFLDLLASRELEVGGQSAGSLTALRQVQRRLTTGAKPDATAPANDLKLWASADPDLRSLVSVVPMSFAESAAVAGRLGSTVVAYWVADRETFVFVVKANGEAQLKRIPVTSARLKQLLLQTSASFAGGPGRSGDSAQDPGTSRSTDGVFARASADLVAPRVVGTALVVPDAGGRQAWRELYTLLVAPIRSALPRTSGSMLTIIPHGPLFGLSFAALIDERSHYLLEDYTLHYAPAVGLFPFTERRTQSTRREPSSYLLVANPDNMPETAPNKPLPSLPGSGREVEEIARLLPSDRLTVLTGQRAREETLRSAIGGKSVVHVATHGVLRDEDPLGSFLALSGSGAGRASDGRLTAEEIYALSINADLVVLSACRTGLGPVSGDGIVGLTRAFFYAGASSVVASLWDVADEPAVYLMPRFYRLMNQRGLKSRALRQAQLDMLSDLRAGRIQVASPAGPLSLPEHPMLWASFVLQGEP